MAKAARWAGRLGGPVLVALSLLWFGFIGLGPRTGQYRTLTVLTGSMRPAIAPGSLVVVTPVPLEQVAVGDVLTYEAPLPDRRVVTHRVVEVRHDGGAPVVRTKGDANAAPDPWEARLSGGPAWRVRAAVPHAGRAVQALRTPLVRQAAVWLAPLALALLWLRQIWSPPPAPAAPAPPPVPARPVPPPRSGDVRVPAYGRERRQNGGRLLPVLVAMTFALLVVRRRHARVA